MRQIIAGDSCQGQVEGILPLYDPTTRQTNFVWHSTSVPGGPRVAWGGHIFNPLRFKDDGSVHELDCTPEAISSVSFIAGTTSKATGKAVAASNITPKFANYYPVCDSDVFTLLQTWKSSQSGVLREVAVNIAKGSQKSPLFLEVFKFSSYQDLTSPHYRYQSLGKRIIAANSKDLSFAFMTVSVTNMSGNVLVGEYLGLKISGSDISPYCHLEYNTKVYSDGINDRSPGKLFVQGAGQNSWRGLDGKTSVVYEREGKALKFWAKVEN